MRRLAEQYPRYGYRRIRIFLEREGFELCPQRMHRLWRQEQQQTPATHGAGDGTKGVRVKPVVGVEHGHQPLVGAVRR